jgi:drug/metabolite transporter (DMT)-like permease
MEEKSQPKNIFLIGMVLSMICWGFSWTSGKVLAMYGDPMTISFLRFGLTFVSLLFIVLLLKESFALKLSGLKNLFIAASLISIYTFLFFKGLTTGKAGAGGVLVTTLNPIIAYALMLVIGRRKPTGNETIGLAIGLVAGVVLLNVFTNTANLFTAGNVYFLLAAVCWAVLSLFTAKASRYGSSITFSFWMYGISTGLLFLFSGYQHAWHLILTGDFVFWINLFFSATITTSLATTFYFYATAKVGAGKASSFIFMVPFSAALGSWIFLLEIPKLNTIIGGLLGIAAVYIINKKPKPIS